MSLQRGSSSGTPAKDGAGTSYWLNSRGTAYCVSADSGNVVYDERLDPPTGTVYASPLLADGMLYYVSRENGTFVLGAEPQLKLLAHNTIASDPSIFNASPAVVDGQLLLRSNRCLYCIGTRP